MQGSRTTLLNGMRLGYTGIVKLMMPRFPPVIHHLELQSYGCGKVVEISLDGPFEDRASCIHSENDDTENKLQTRLQQDGGLNVQWRLEI